MHRWGGVSLELRKEKDGRGCGHIRDAQLRPSSQIPPGEGGRLAVFIPGSGLGMGVGRKLLPPSVGSLTVFQSSARDSQLPRHLAVHLEVVGAGLGLGLGGACHLPFSYSHKGTFGVWPCLGRGGGTLSMFICH